MIERAKGHVLLWADLPDAQRAGDDDEDVVAVLVLGLCGRRLPDSAARCEAASQGNTTTLSEARHLVKTGRFFRCIQRRKRGVPDGRFCGRHHAILRAQRRYLVTIYQEKVVKVENAS